MSCNCDNNNNDNKNIISCTNENFGALFNSNCELIKCCVEEMLCKQVEECLEKKRCKTQFVWASPCFTEIVPESIKNRINRRGKLATIFLNSVRPFILEALLTNEFTNLCEVINNNPFIEEFSITDKNGNVIVIC